MNLLPSDFVALLSIFFVLSTLGFIVYTCMKVHAHTLLNIDKFGSDNDKKLLTARQSIFNFYIVVGIALTILSAYLKIFNSSEVFVALFVSELIGLGVKLTFDLKK